MSEQGEVTRRDALKLAAGAAALGASLGIPRAALAMSAEGQPAYEFYFKFWYQGKLMQSIPIDPALADKMVIDPGQVLGKFYRSPREEIGSLQLPAAVQLKLRAASTTFKQAR